MSSSTDSLNSRLTKGSPSMSFPWSPSSASSQPCVPSAFLAGIRPSVEAPLTHKFLPKGRITMPTFRLLDAEEVAALRHHRRSSTDLAPYREFIRDIPQGEGGELTLDPKEQKRTIKRWI